MSKGKIRMIRSRLLVAAAAGALALSAAALAVAQDAPGAGGHPWRARMQERMQARREQSLADLRQVLKLRPDQEAAFQTLLAALKPPERPGRPPAEAQPAGALTTPQMIARRAQRFAEIKARMDRRDQAVLAFYGALAPDQQKTFDSLMRLRLRGPLMGGGMGMGPMDRMRHMGRMGPMEPMGRMGPGRPGGPGGPDGPPPPPR
jgi:hypothetical protein